MFLPVHMWIYIGMFVLMLIYIGIVANIFIKEE